MSKYCISTASVVKTTQKSSLSKSNNIMMKYDLVKGEPCEQWLSKSLNKWYKWITHIFTCKYIQWVDLYRLADYRSGIQFYFKTFDFLLWLKSFNKCSEQKLQHLAPKCRQLEAPTSRIWKYLGCVQIPQICTWVNIFTLHDWVQFWGTLLYMSLVNERILFTEGSEYSFQQCQL